MFPAQALDGFSCHDEEVQASYKYKHLKAAFTNVAQKEPWSAKVGAAGRQAGGEASKGGSSRLAAGSWCVHLHLLIAAAAALPASSSLQVCISSRGVLKVTHMLTLAGSAAMAPEPQPLMGTFTSQVRRAVGWVGPASW